MKIFNRNAYQTELDLADHLSGMPATTFWSKWFGGVLIPIILLSHGVKCCVTMQAVLMGSHQSSLDLNGRQAIAFGITWICVSFFLHFHYFWTALKRWYVFAYMGKVIFAFGIILSMGYVLGSIMISWATMF